MKKERSILALMILDGRSIDADCIKRPSNLRISSLEDENAKLRRSLATLKSSLRSEQLPTRVEPLQNAALGDRSSHSGHRERISNRQTIDNVDQALPRNKSSLVISSQDHSTTTAQKTRYHGPSSAMFDGEPSCQRRKIDSGNMLDSNTRAHLLAEATKQRKKSYLHVESSTIRLVH